MAKGTFNRFAAGKKVYGQGSYSPTKGTVDPTGYIKRELRKRNLKTREDDLGSHKGRGRGRGRGGRSTPAPVTSTLGSKPIGRRPVGNLGTPTPVAGVKPIGRRPLVTKPGRSIRPIIGRKDAGLPKNPIKPRPGGGPGGRYPRRPSTITVPWKR